MTDFRSIADIRRDYGELSLNEASVLIDPIAQFDLWFSEVLKTEKNDPTAMVLSTVDKQGRPDSRVVLLKGIDNGNFIFYTNYQSAKGAQIASHPYAALNFYWPQMARQVRVRGQINKVGAKQSDDYFSSRPIISQFSAIISPQSQVIATRSVLDDALADIMQNNNPIVRPKHWGGYRIIPDQIEFWQGRDNRLHDRIQYCRQGNTWQCQRLAP